MKKILAGLTSLLITYSSAITVVACQPPDIVEETKSPVLKVNLDSVLQETNLGNFDYEPTSQEILNRLEEKNIKLDINEVEVISNLYEKAIINVLSESEVYFPGSIEVSYKNEYLIDLSSVFDNPVQNLGVFTRMPTRETFLNLFGNMINTKEFEIKDFTSTSAILKVIENSKSYRQGQIKLEFQLDIRYDLTTVLTETNLGEFDFHPKKTDIWKRLKELNPHLDLTQIRIVHNIIANDSLEIELIENSRVYNLQGTRQMTLYYHIKGMIHLTNVLKQTDLGIFDPYARYEVVLARIQELNPDLDISQIEIDPKWNDYLFNDGTVVIKVIENSLVYYEHDGLFKFTYKVHLEKLLREIYLGKIEVKLGYTFEQAVLFKIQDLNHGIHIYQIAVKKVLTPSTEKYGIIIVSASKYSIYVPTEFKIYYLK